MGSGQARPDAWHHFEESRCKPLVGCRLGCQAMPHSDYSSRFGNDDPGRGILSPLLGERERRGSWRVCGTTVFHALSVRVRVGGDKEKRMHPSLALIHLP
jgi:hypothetical protein